MKKILLSLVFFVILTNVYSERIAFTGDARSLGMGSAFYAISNDASAMFWNPAGLDHFILNQREGLISLKANQRDSTYQDMFAFTGQVMKKKEGIKFSIKDYLENKLRKEVRDEQLNYNYGVGLLFSENKYRKVSSALFAIGKSVPKIDNLKVGARFQFENVDPKSAYVSESKHTEFSLDLGALYKFNPYLDIGLMLENLITQGGDKEYLPTIVSVGFAIHVRDDLIIGLDGYNLFDSASSPNLQTEFRIGIEKIIVEDNLSLRIGSKNGNLNLGFGLKLTNTFHVDYAYMGNQEGDDGHSHMISSKLRF